MNCRQCSVFLRIAPATGSWLHAPVTCPSCGSPHCVIASDMDASTGPTPEEVERGAVAAYAGHISVPLEQAAAMWLQEGDRDHYRRIARAVLDTKPATGGGGG